MPTSDLTFEFKSPKLDEKSKNYSISYKYQTGMKEPEIKVEGDATDEEINHFLIYLLVFQAVTFLYRLPEHCKGLAGRRPGWPSDLPCRARHPIGHGIR